MKNFDSLSRRSVIGGMVSAAAVPLLASRGFAEASAKTAQPKAIAAFEGDYIAPTEQWLAPRFHQSLVTLQNGCVLITGGYLVSDEQRNPDITAPVSQTIILDPATGNWVRASDMLVPRARHASTLLPDGRVVVSGGIFAQPLDSTEIYDPATNRWTSGPQLPRAFVDHASSALGDAIILSGGQYGDLALVHRVPSAPRQAQP